MAKRLYLGVEGFLIHRLDKSQGAERMFRMTTYGLDFLSWAVDRFECRWVTRLDHFGGDQRIRRALALAQGLRKLPPEFDLLFEYVLPTYWEDSMIEGIDTQSDFYWVASDVDESSREVLARLGLRERVIIATALDTIEEVARLQFRLP